MKKQRFDKASVRLLIKHLTLYKEYLEGFLSSSNLSIGRANFLIKNSDGKYKKQIIKERSLLLKANKEIKRKIYPIEFIINELNENHVIKRKI